MTHTFLADLHPGRDVDGIYQVKEKEVKTTRNGDMFLTLKLSDRTDTLDAVLWQASRGVIDAFQADDYIKVRGHTETYRNKLQLRLQHLTRIDAAQVHQEDFLPTTPQDVEQLAGRMTEILHTVENRDIRTLLFSFWNDEAFRSAFCRSPAATHFHHAYLGGLLEHVVSLCEIWMLLAPRYPDVNRDMVLAGLFLHDMGKLAELSSAHAIRYTDDGLLTGHIVLGAMMLEEKSRHLQDMPHEIIVQLRHILLSHHGLPEWGTVKPPMTPEAIAVHHLDNLDAKLHASVKCIHDRIDTGSRWTEYSPMFGGKLYCGKISP